MTKPTPKEWFSLNSPKDADSCQMNSLNNTPTNIAMHKASLSLAYGNTYTDPSNLHSALTTLEWNTLVTKGLTPEARH
ncbi:hypothetical protein ACHAW6_001492 [Cyclotella cf. meneghiniana]